MNHADEKCPRCGTRWNGVSEFCPVCNYEFSQTNSAPTVDRSRPIVQPRETPTPLFPKPARPQPVIFQGGGRSNPAPVPSPTTVSLADLLKGLSGRACLTGIVMSISHDTAYPKRSWWGTLLTISITGFLIVSLGAAAITMLVPLLFILCIFVLMFRMMGNMLSDFFNFGKRQKGGPGFFSTLIGNYLSSVISFNVTKAREKVPVLNIRLKVGDNTYRDVRIQGEVLAGNFNVGDEIEVEGFYRGGTLIFQRGRNHKTQAEIIIRRR